MDPIPDNNPVPPPPQPAPKRIMLILLVLLFILLGSSSYLAFQNYQLKKMIGKPSTSPFPTSSPILDPTADWKTYTNNKYGYSIKYPPEYIVNTAKTYNPPEALVNLNNQENVSISIAWGNQGSLCANNTLPCDPVQLIKATIEGQVYEPKEQYYMNDTRNYQFKFYIDGKDVDLEGVFTNKEDASEISQILSTLKFLPPTPSPVPQISAAPIEIIKYTPRSDWGFLEDPVAKFSMQYPSNYQGNDYVNGKGGNYASCNTDPTRGKICLSGFWINIYNNYTGGSRRQWLADQNLGIPYSESNTLYKDFVVDGKNTLAIFDLNSGGSTGSWVVIPNGSQVVVISFPFGGSPSSGITAVKDFLSTFKFTN